MAFFLCDRTNVKSYETLVPYDLTRGIFCDEKTAPWWGLGGVVWQALSTTSILNLLGDVKWSRVSKDSHRGWIEMLACYIMMFIHC
jgi:hypothetical protein